MRKRRRQFLKSGFMVICTILIVSVLGCTDTSRTETQVTEKIVSVCKELYRKAAEENEPDNLEAIRKIITQLGAYGYTAVDGANQIDMTCAEDAIRFCEAVDAKKEGNVTIIQVMDLESFIIYELRTEDGNVDVCRSYYKYADGELQRGSEDNYTADSWDYTEEGYILFSGSWFSEMHYAFTMSDAKEQVALRVQPLDEKCREYNRKYILPVGYGLNNLFVVDWSENDFGALDFYDLYDIFYPLIYDQPVPYPMDPNLGVGAVYRIPKEEFERVIMTYLNIDSETLRLKTTYYPEDAAYEYKPRGFYDNRSPKCPYPEVVGYTENSDGTITLTVNVVAPYAGLSKVYAHEVVVRPQENNGVQYVSNHIIPADDNADEKWYKPRLTAEEWEKRYEEHE